MAEPRSVCTTVSCGWLEPAGTALATANPSLKLTVNNHAVGGQGQATSYSVAQTWITAGGIKFLVWFPWSQNDGVTAAIINNDFNTYVPEIITLAHAHGAIPVLLTAIPTVLITTCIDDNARTANNASLLAMASSTVITADMDAVMSAGGCPATITPSLTPDGRHPNVAGAAAMKPVIQNAIQTWLNNFGP